jgi:DNA-binding MarR family transcriptional regulator
MRSQFERKNPPENTDYRELRLLSEVDEDPHISQRQLSQRMGIALGLTNVMLRNLVQKGYIRATKAGLKSWLYYLTPEGFSLKIKLTLSYVHRVLNHYRNVRQTLAEELAPLSLNPESRVAIYGTTELAELVFLGLGDYGIEEIDIFTAEQANGARFLAMPVQDIKSMIPERHDRVMVATIGGSERAFAQLKQQGVEPSRLVSFFPGGKIEEAQWMD